jgi:tetratricopeptide (TPR) repeat protein
VVRQPYILPQTDTSSPEFKRRTLNVMVAMIEDLARRQSILLVVEDAHWIDPSTLELIRLLLERLVAARLLVLVTARPEFKPAWTYPHLLQLSLDRLSRRDRSEMIDRLTAGKALPGVVLEQIVAKTDGVPLFVEELTKAVLQGDLLRDTGERYELKGALLSIAVPDTLQGSLLSRLDRLDPGVKELAQIAATIGREFERGLLSLVASKPERDLQSALDRLIAEDIILPAPGSAEEGGAYLFRHALIQDIAYNSLLQARRRQYHGLIADALEARYPEVVERQPERVAQNLAASETPERAIEYWRLAGERALARAAYEEAIAHATAGIRLIGTLPTNPDRTAATAALLMIRGKAENDSGKRQAMETYRQVLHIARVEKRPSDFVAAVLEFDRVANYLGSFGGEAVVLLDEALAMLGSNESVDRCRVLSRLANTLYITGSFERAAETARQAVILGRRLGDDASLVDALSCELTLIGGRPLPISEFADRRRHLEELREVAERLGVEDQVGFVCTRLTCSYLEIGDYQGFESAMERYREVAANIHNMVHSVVEAGSQAMRAILVGDFDLAERKAGETYELAESADTNVSAGVYGMQMFTIRREQGRLGEVAPLIKRFVDENPENAQWRPGLMLIASDLGFEAQAHRTLETMAELDFAVPMDVKRMVTWTYIAEVAARLGEARHVERIYELLLPYRDQAVTVPAFTLCCGSAARYLGLLAGALGDWSNAETHFEYALQMNERMHAWPWLAHARHEFALMLIARNGKGDRARAADLLKSAAATANELKMFALEERIRGVKSASRQRTSQVNTA